MIKRVEKLLSILWIALVLRTVDVVLNDLRSALHEPPPDPGTLLWWTFGAFVVCVVAWLVVTFIELWRSACQFPIATGEALDRLAENWRVTRIVESDEDLRARLQHHISGGRP